MSRLPEKARVFLELVKFEHSVFALPYAYIGALYGAAAGAIALGRMGPAPWMPPTSSFGIFLPGTSRWIAAGSWPTWSAILWITVVMVGARAFAFVLNRAVDAEIDARNPRTAGRALPAGLLKAWELWVFSVAVLAAYVFGVWQLAPLTRWLWPIPLAVFVIYPYVKRVSRLAHYWLGIALGLAPIGGWIAVGGPIAHPAPWVFGLAVTLWTAGFDIIYATQDYDCDVRDGIHSVPADFGIGPALVHTRVLHVLTVACLVLGGYAAHAGWPWYAGVGVAAVLLAYENAIVRAEDLSRVNAAFFTVNGIIAIVVFAGALVDNVLA